MSNSTYNGSDSYFVFPNGRFMSKFALVSSEDSGLTQTDKDLYNDCYLPYRNLKERSTVSKPNYQIDEAPCKRQAAINANCYFTWNGTLASIDVQNDTLAQQNCFCDVYPFFEAASGCQSCFEKHGGIEGYHWFPQSYLSAASATYCSASPVSTGFYPFVSSWAANAAVAKVPTTTASDLLGTNTAVSGYYTASPTSTKASMGISSTGLETGYLLLPMLLACFLVR